MSYIDSETGKYVGFDTEMMEDLADSLAVGIEYLGTPWQTLMEDVLGEKFT